MDINQKRDAALKLLESSGAGRGNFAPLLVRLLWRMGFDIPPPYFGSFLGNAFRMGMFFSAVWGVIMWVSVWSHQGKSPMSALIATAGAGFFYGIVMGGYFAYGKHKHQLPSWREFNPES
ncbi:MAG: DUF6404 family protein [Pseudomonadota bacterium]